LASDRNTIWSLNTAAGVAEMSRLTTFSGQPSFAEPAWAVAAPDLGIMVSGKKNTRTLTIWNISAATPSAYSQVTAPATDTLGASVVYDESALYGAQGATTFQSSYNPVYHQPSRSILLYEGARKPSGKIHQLRIPVSGGAYNHAGSWTITTRQTTGAPTSTYSNYGRFNMVNDIGNGEPVLVLSHRNTEPTYVCRIGSLA
jgi:hypothetical protein